MRRTELLLENDESALHHATIRGATGQRRPGHLNRRVESTVEGGAHVQSAGMDVGDAASSPAASVNHPQK